MGIRHALARQFRQPHGLVGRLLGLLFRLNREGNEWAVGLLDIRQADHVLEIGFGPGFAVQKIASLVLQGFVAGVDFSEVMLAQASRRNAAAIAGGQVDLRLGEASRLPFPDNRFDKAFAGNVMYFWEDPLVELKELRRVLKPGGRLAFYLVSKEDLLKTKVTQTGVYRLYTGEEAVRLLTDAGFSHARFQTRNERLRTGVCVLAEK